MPTRKDAAPAAQLREDNRAAQADLRRSFLEGGIGSRELIEARARLVDGLLERLWRSHHFPAGLALVAVGGYGRGELYPGSDVDLLILLPEATDAAVLSKLEALVGEFWDIGLEVGHSVRTVAECVAEGSADITIQTSLIESRLLVGDNALYESFRRGLLAALDPRAFFRAKLAEQGERHLRHHETPFALEPNCKEGPGGLRDLQMILWLANAAGFGGDWRALRLHGIVTREEEKNLFAGEAFLRNLRVRLHLYTGRREDRLLFDVQTALAEQMGYASTEERRAGERMMQDYYQNAKMVTQLNTLVLQSIGARFNGDHDREPPRPLDDAFQIRGGALDVLRASVFEEKPGRLLECFHHLQANDLRAMTVRTIRALWRGRRLIDDAFRADPDNRARFLRLIQNDSGLIHQFRRMNQWGILGEYLPAFGKIVGRMQHDLFHAYTVDQHILLVMRNVRRFTMERHAHEYPFENRLINGFEKPWVLYVAALFHDIAKGRKGDHSLLGMEDARRFCIDHRIDDEDTELIVWLVREHLTMSRVAQKEDVSDPQVVRAFAATVGDERRLTALYLLTVADIRATSPKVWNGWKAQLLASLYQSTVTILRGDKPVEIHGALAERQRDAMRLIRYFALPDSVQERFWRHLDTVYFLRHTAEEIAWHTRALHYRVNTDEPVVKARLNRFEDLPDGVVPTLERGEDGSSGLQVMVYAKDRPDMFLRLAGFFARAGFSIVDARIHTTAHGYALDSFVLLDVQGRDTDREMISYIEYELSSRLRSDGPPDVPAAGRLSRQARHFPIRPQVNIHPDDKGSNYILSVVATDRPGLLFTVALTLGHYGADLHTAKIHTLGERVEDTFLISGKGLEHAAHRLALETELTEALKV